MRNKLTQFVSVVIFFILMPGLFSCTTQATPAPQAAATPVKFQASWVYSVEQAGMFMAKENNHYADAGLDVEILSGGFDADGNFIDPVEEALSGRSDFSIVDGGALLKAREEGKPLVAVASIYQRLPLAFTSLKEKNIVRPQDLVGKNVQIASNSEVIYQALLASQGIDPAQINMVERTDFTTQPLLTGEADVTDDWVTSAVTELAMAGEETNLILPSDYGIDMYPDVIVTTEDIIATQPDMVKSFVQATIKGMEDVVANPDGAAKVTFEKYAKDRGLEVEQEAIQRSLPLLNPTDSSPGQMKPEVWEKTHEILLEQGILSNPVDVEAAYTLEFLQ